MPQLVGDPTAIVAAIPQLQASLLELSGKRCLIEPIPGAMVVFPSWLNHQVHPFRGAGARISIAFNVQISEGRGTSDRPR